MSDLLDTVIFYRDNVMLHPTAEKMPSLKDADEQKLSAIDKLLRAIFQLHAELTSVGIKLQIDKNGSWSSKPKVFKLQDLNYTDFSEFKIIIKSPWLNPEVRQFAIHANFEFQLYIIQDGFEGRHEIADWINICIQYLNTTPMSWASSREHVKTLTKFIKNKDRLYFKDLPIEFKTHVEAESHRLSFSTAQFIQSVNDSCTIIKKIIRRKNNLISITNKK